MQDTIGSSSSGGGEKTLTQTIYVPIDKTLRSHTDKLTTVLTVSVSETSPL